MILRGPGRGAIDGSRPGADNGRATLRPSAARAGSGGSRRSGARPRGFRIHEACHRRRRAADCPLRLFKLTVKDRGRAEPEPAAVRVGCGGRRGRPGAALVAKYPDRADLVRRVYDEYRQNALAIERTDGLRGLTLLDTLDLEAIYLYEKHPERLPPAPRHPDRRRRGRPPAPLARVLRPEAGRRHRPRAS